MTERIYKLSEDERRYFSQYQRERRRRIRAGLPSKEPKPIPEKPTKDLRRKDFSAYMAAYMRWRRYHGPARENLDPDGKDWAK